MNVKFFLMISLMGMLILFGGCTNKANPTGDNWSGIRPISIVDTLFTDGFSYPTEGLVSGKESVMLVGNFEGRTATAVMRFTGLPEPANFSTVSNAELKFVVSRRSPMSRSAINLTLHKLNQEWAADSTFQIQNSNISAPINISNITVPDTLSYATGDTISVLIPANDIQNWQTSGVTGFNLVIKTESDGFCELRALESGYGALLSFTYKLTGDTADRTFNMRTIMDSHIITAPVYAMETDAWTLQNINPSRMYLRFEIDPDKFVDNNGEILTAQQYKRCTINKAELVLYIKENPYYDKYIHSMLPYNVTKTYPFDPVELTNNDMQLISYTTATNQIASSDSIVINITSIVQAFTSGDRVNNGIVLRSLHEMINFGVIKFWHFNDTDPNRKTPKIKVTYTPPFL